MDPTSEIPEGEKVVVTPELASRMGEATNAIEQNIVEPGADIAAATGQMSMMAELGKLWKDTTVKRLGILFKDAKVALPNGEMFAWEKERQEFPKLYSYINAQH